MITSINYEKRTVTMEVNFDLFEVMTEGLQSFLKAERVSRLVHEVMNGKEKKRSALEQKIFDLKDDRLKKGQDALKDFLSGVEESELGQAQEAVKNKVGAIGDFIAEKKTYEAVHEARNILESLIPELRRVTSYPEETIQIAYVAVDLTREVLIDFDKKEAKGE